MPLTSAHLLKAHALRHTEARERILDIFLKQARALSHTDLEADMGTGADRVTVYRTLKTFTEKGLLHTIPDGQDNIRYALCFSGCNPGAHRHNHIHFKCVSCSNTRCLEKVTIPDVNLPDGYIFLDANYIIQGICSTCGAEKVA